MESSPDTLTDIAQECTQNVQRITSEDTELTQVHTIFLLFVSLYKTNVINYNWGRTMHLAILHNYASDHKTNQGKGTIQ